MRTKFDQREEPLISCKRNAAWVKMTMKQHSSTSHRKGKKENSKINTMDFRKPYFKNLTVPIISLREKRIQESLQHLKETMVRASIQTIPAAQGKQLFERNKQFS